MDIDRHSRNRQVVLARSIAGRKKVYLDACYWIIVRDAALGIRMGADEQKLLALLRQGVANGKLVCPISAAMFIELMKQPNTAGRRVATAALIDELSLGVSLMPPRTIVGTEIHSFMLKSLQKGELYPMQELVWTKVAYVLGNQYPVIKELPADDLYRLQVSFFDYLWEAPLSKMVEMIGDAPRPNDDFRRLSEQMNRDCATFAHELKSFEGTYDIELRGAVDLLGDIVADVMYHLHEKKLGSAPILTDDQRQATANAGRQILYHALKKHEHRDLMRSIHIEVLFHAAMRWDKQRKFKPNDYFDFQHGTAALAYCDLFLTEKPLWDMIRRPQLNLESVNGCRTVWELGEAVDALETLSHRPERAAAFGLDGGNVG